LQLRHTSGSHKGLDVPRQQLLLHRDLGPSRQFSQTADVVGCSESTLRRRAEQWNWVERLAEYDSGMLQKASEARTKEELDRYKHQTSQIACGGTVEGAFQPP